MVITAAIQRKRLVILRRLRQRVRVKVLATAGVIYSRSALERASGRSSKKNITFRIGLPGYACAYRLPAQTRLREHVPSR